MTPTFDPILSKLRNKDNTQQITSILNDIDALKLYNKRFQPLKANITEFDANDLTIKAFESQDLDNLALKGLDETNFLEKIENLNNQYGEDLLNEYKTIRPIVLLYNGVRNYINNDTKHAIDCWYGLLFQTGFDQTIIAQARDVYYLYEWEKIGDGEIHTKNEEYADNGTRQIIAYRNLTLGKEAQQWTITEITNNQNNQIEPYDDTELKTALQQQLSEINSAIDKLQQQLSEINLETFETEAIQIIAQVEKIEQNYTDFQEQINSILLDLLTNLEEFVLGPELTAVYNSDDCCITLTQDTESKSLFLFKAYDEYGRSDIRLTLLGQQDIILFRSQVERKKGIFYHNNYYIAYEILYFEELGNLAGVPSRYYRWLIISAQDAIELYTAYQQYKDGDLDYTLLLQAIENMVGSENISNIYYSDDDLFPMLDSQIQKLNAYNSGYDDGLQGHENNNTYESGTDLYNSYESGYSDGYAVYEASQTPEPEPEPEPEPDPEPEPEPEPTDENNPEDNPEE